MGFFRKKKGSANHHPLNSTYQGDDTPGRSPPRTKNAPLTPDTVEDNDGINENEAANVNAKSKKKIWSRKSKNKQKQTVYLKVTPDKNLEQQTEPQEDDMATPPQQEQDDNIPSLLTPGRYDELPPSPSNEEKAEAKRNLNAVFDESCEDELRDQIKITSLNGNGNKTSKEDRKFLKRFKVTSWKKGGDDQQQQQQDSSKDWATRLIEEQNAQLQLEQQQQALEEKPSPVPKIIDSDDVGSVPSLITEMTGAQEPKINTNTNTELARSTSNNSQPEPHHPVITPTISPLPLPRQQQQTFFSESFSTVTKPPPKKKLSLTQKVMSLLQCGEDTTQDSGFLGNLCGPMDREGKESLRRLEREEEERFVVGFMSELSKHGIKLIYHEPPTSTDPSSDWTQLTIKMFLRPGKTSSSSTSSKQVHPTLAWAILPVASRSILTGSYENDESQDKEKWTYLSLWDIYSIMGAEDDATATVTEYELHSPARSKYTFSSTIQSEYDSRCDTREDTASYTHTRTFDEDGTRATSGFFSITSGSDGAVYVFEATSAVQRDYIVRGLKKLVGRAAGQVIAGKVDVCAELYGEDVKPMSGELPSLVTPAQALERVTHSFLDDL